MSMYPQEPNTIPEETARVAHAAYPHRTLAMRLRDALVLVLQYMEGLTDRQAADAVRGRIDWKYPLWLPLEDPGFDASVSRSFARAWWKQEQSDCS